MAGAGVDRVRAHRNIVRGTEKYNICDFEENRAERHFPIALERGPFRFGQVGQIAKN